MDKKRMLEDLITYYAGGNKTKFASMLGMTPSGLGNWLKRETFDAAKLFTHCAGLSPAWLLTGEGDMITRAPSDTAAGDFTEATLNSHLNLSQAVRDLAEANRRLTEEIDRLKQNR